MDLSSESSIPDLFKSTSNSAKVYSTRTRRSSRTRICPPISSPTRSEQANSSDPSESLGNRPVQTRKQKKTPRNWEYRSKHVQELFSTPPYHPDFFDDKSKQRYDEHFSSKNVILEKAVDVGVPEVENILKESKLDSCTNLSGPVNQSLVAEFYANITDGVADEGSPFHHRVFVRGIWVRFSPYEINTVLGAPDIETIYSPELTRDHIAPSAVISALTNDLVHIWPSNTLVPRSQLPTTFAQLLKLVKSQWIPSSHQSNFNIREAMLMYLLVMEPSNVSIGAVIHENIIERSIPHSQRQLIHPILITKLLQSQHVPTRESDKIIPSSGLLRTNRRLAQGNRINDIPEPPVQSLSPTLKALILKEVEGLQVENARSQFRLDTLYRLLTDDDGGEN